MAKRQDEFIGTHELAMNYPDLFKSRYETLQGRDWINYVDPEDKQAFIELGLKEMEYGRKGGLATLKKHGREHYKKMARIGAIATNSRRQWNIAVADETARLLEEAH